LVCFIFALNDYLVGSRNRKRDFTVIHLKGELLAIIKEPSTSFSLLYYAQVFSTV
jgi:hypothetical protein